MKMLAAGAVLLMWSVVLNAAPPSEKMANALEIKLVRMIDTKEEYGKSCEAYTYIPALQRLNLLHHHDFMLGDILADTLSISRVEPEYLQETNLTECSSGDIMLNEYTYAEALGYLNDSVITIDVFQYIYGAGAAHGNGHMFHYIYERDYGMRLDWEDLFDHNKAFELYVLKRVVKEIADEDFIAHFKLSKQLLNFKIPGYFTLTEKGLLIQYGKYEITGGSSGLPSLVISKKVLKRYMSQEKYKRYFMTRTEELAEILDDF